MSFYKLEIANSFKLLTLREKMYTYHMANAAWVGARIIMKQRSLESTEIFDFLLDLFKNKQNISPHDDTIWEKIVDYTAQVFGNLGNYHGLTGEKIVPNVPLNVFKNLLPPDSILQTKFDEISRIMYSPEPKKLGFFTEGGMTIYHSLEITRTDAEKAHRFILHTGIPIENTRLIKHIDGIFVITIAAITQKQTSPIEFEGSQYVLLYGDYSKELIELNKHLEHAYKRAGTNAQRDMIKDYIKHFEIGTHYKGEWIRDHTLAVETMGLGFVEQGRDPAGKRQEFSLMVSIVDKNANEKFHDLILHAQKLIDTLPLPRDYTNNTFCVSSNLTSLNILTCASSLLPPNYTNNFKNVVLSNIIYNLGLPKFLEEKYQNNQSTLLKTFCFEINFGLREFIGRETGRLKLIYENEKVINPLTGKPVKTWYLPGETWNSKFGDILCNLWDECRAECICLYLSVNSCIPDIFKISPLYLKDVVTTIWYNVCLAGLRALDDYSNGKWYNQRSHAQYIILQTLLEAGNGFVSISAVDNKDITIDPTLINTVGIPAINQLLTYLNIYKSTADIDNMTTLFAKYNPKMLSTVPTPKKTKLFVQPNIVLCPNGAKLIEYPATAEGMIQSFLDRNI